MTKERELLREPTDKQVSETLQLFRSELDKNMHNSSGSPGHDAMRVALRHMFTIDQALAPSAAGGTNEVSLPFEKHPTMPNHATTGDAINKAPSLSGEEIEAIRFGNDIQSPSREAINKLCDLAQSARKARGEAYEECARICDAFAAKYPASFTIHSEFMQAAEAIRQAAREGGKP